MLEEYAKRKTSLLNALSVISEVAGTADRSSVKEMAQETASRLKQETFHLVVLGEFKRGKSTLINALLGKQVVPSGVTPLTSVATEIKYADADHARVHFLDGDSTTVLLSDIHEYATEKHNPLNRKRVARVEAFVRSPFLQEGLVLVDTPGVGSTYTHNTKSAYDYLPLADAAIFVVSADPPISQAECSFLHDVRKYVSKVFFVQNKVDHLSDEDMAESMQFTRDVISREAGVPELRLYPLSARLALDAKLASDPELLDRSMLREFETDLAGFLAEGKGRTLLESASAKASRLLEDVRLSLALEIKAITTPYEELASKAEGFSALAARVEREQAESEWILDGEVEKASQMVADEIESFNKQTTTRVQVDLDDRLEAWKDIPVRDLPEALTGYIKERILEEFTPFREAEVRLVENRFRQMAENVSAIVTPRIAEIRASAAKLFGMDVNIKTEPVTFQEETDFYFDLKEIPTFTLFRPGTLQQLLPGRIAREMIRKDIRERIEILVDRQCGRIRYDLVTRLKNSAGNLKEELRRRFADLSSTTDRLYRTALERKRSGEDGVVERVRQIESLITRLQDAENMARTMESRTRAN